MQSTTKLRLYSTEIEFDFLRKLNDIQNIHLNKKCIDSVDTVYKEAVFKLKYLLAESYTLKPTTSKPLDIKGIYQVSNIKTVEPKQVAIKKCIIDHSEVKNVHGNIVTDLQTVSPKLIIKQQEEYIQQLEQESQFCRKQLINLLCNVQEIITENETLHYKNGTELCKDIFDSYITINEIDRSMKKYIANKKRQIEQKHDQQDAKISTNAICYCNIANKSQLEIEKKRKELAELRTELSQKETFITNLKMEFQQKILNLQSKLNKVQTEKDIVERELLTTKSTAQQHGKEYCQEQNKFQMEIYSYKERLDRVNVELDQYRRENLKLSEKLASLKEEVTCILNSKKRTVKVDLKIKLIPKQK